MRIKVTLNSPSETSMDMNYNYYLSSMIYELLRKSDTQYAARLHESGYLLGNKKFKLFTFSNLFPERYTVEKNFLNLKGRVTLYISSPMSDFTLHLAEGLLSSGNVNIGRSRFFIETVEVMPLPEFSREMRLTCLSPITTNTVEEKDGKRRTVPCLPGSDKFSENIKNNLIRKYFLVHKRLPEDLAFEIEFNNSDLDKYGRGKLIRFKNLFIKAYSMPFILRGSTELIKIGYECGIGEKNPAGLGMVERR